MRLAYPYLRYSTSEQAKGDSTRRQQDWFEAVCAAEGWQIDTSFPLEDKGISAFKGDHLKADLGRFLQAVATERIPKGSVLLVEELDRLSRQERKKALPMVMGILSAGIDIRTRTRHYTEDSLDDLGSFIDLTIKQGTANEESRKKSDRISAIWQNWRKQISEGKHVPPPGRLPAWIRWNGKAFELIPGPAATMKFIYQLAGDGLGLRRILARLQGNETDKAIPVIATHKKRSPTWRLSYLAKLLSWRAVLGEFEDRLGTVYPNLYPAVVTEQEFYRGRAALEGRKIGNKGVGRTGETVANLFVGLLHDMRDGSRLHLIDKGRKGGGRFLVSSAFLRHEPHTVSTPFHYPTFEAAIVGRLKEIDPREILGQPNAPDEVMILSGKLRAVEDAIAAISAELDEHGESPTLFRRLRDRETQRAELAHDLATARARAAHPLSESWGEAQTIIGALNGPETRLRFQAALRRVVEGMWCLFVQRGRQERIAAVRMQFAGGAHREYLILCRTFCSSGKNRKDPKWWARSFMSADCLVGVDLSKREDVKRMEDYLFKLDCSQWEERPKDR